MLRSSPGTWSYFGSVSYCGGSAGGGEPYWFPGAFISTWWPPLPPVLCVMALAVSTPWVSPCLDPKKLSLFRASTQTNKNLKPHETDSKQVNNKQKHINKWAKQFHSCTKHTYMFKVHFTEDLGRSQGIQNSSMLWFFLLSLCCLSFSGAKYFLSLSHT